MSETTELAERIATSTSRLRVGGTIWFAGYTIQLLAIEGEEAVLEMKQESKP